MVKFFSVDWLAQSHQQERAVVHAHRPHVPCMVQPRAPTFGQSSLQAKPKAWKPPQQPEDRGYQEDPRDRSSLSSCKYLNLRGTRAHAHTHTCNQLLLVPQVQS